MVGDGDPERYDRKALLDPQFRFIGAAYGEHRSQYKKMVPAQIHYYYTYWYTCTYRFPSAAAVHQSGGRLQGRSGARRVLLVQETGRRTPNPSQTAATSSLSADPRAAVYRLRRPSPFFGTRSHHGAQWRCSGDLRSRASRTSPRRKWPLRPSSTARRPSTRHVCRFFQRGASIYRALGSGETSRRLRGTGRQTGRRCCWRVSASRSLFSLYIYIFVPFLSLPLLLTLHSHTVTYFFDESYLSAAGSRS